MKRVVLCSLLIVIAASPAGAQRPGGGGGGNRAERDFKHIDADDDGRISREEWAGRGNFDLLDEDGDGTLGVQEMAGLYRTRPWGRFAGTPSPNQQDGTVLADKIPASDMPRSVTCALEVGAGCRAGDAAERGLLDTGLGPLFPKGTLCPGIDDYFAMSYVFKRSRSDARHGGTDIPVAWDTPILAAAAGTVVGIYEGETSMRGREIILRHAPQDTGLPFWTYTQYAHLNARPDLTIGDKVAMGQIIAVTGNSGTSGQGGGHRRPAIHFAAWMADGPRYADSGSAIIPENGFWLDPIGFYRDAPPYESPALKNLPPEQKNTPVGVITNDGTVMPAGSRRIWPYSCAPK